VEDCVYEARSAQLLSGSLMDYAMPRADASGGADGVVLISWHHEAIPAIQSHSSGDKLLLLAL